MGDGDGASTGHLEVRALRREDLAFLLDVRNDCRDMLHDSRQFTLAECEAWFAQGRCDFRIILLDGVPIGYFRFSNYDPDSRSVYVGGDLQRAYRGRGLGRAIYERFLPAIVMEFAVTEVRLEVLSHNTRALHLYRALGFRETGRRRNVAVRAGGPVDSICMALDCVRS